MQAVVKKLLFIVFDTDRDISHALYAALITTSYNIYFRPCKISRWLEI